MKEVKENIWKFKNNKKWMVICTNGTVKDNGESYMNDNGLSCQVNLIYNISKKLGSLITKKGNIPFILTDFDIITLPVKDTYDSNINIDLMKKSISKLIKLVTKLELEEIYISQLDAENKDNWRKVIRPFLMIALDDRFTVVLR